MIVRVVRCAALMVLVSAPFPGHSPVRAAEGDVVTKLRAPVEDIAVAAARQTVVLKLRGQKGLVVYDVTTQKLRTIELPTSDFTFGAGGDTAVVFLTENNEVRSYNLKTLAVVKAKEFADPVILMRIVMGHSRGDLAFVRIARGTNQLSNTSNHLLDVGLPQPGNRGASLTRLRPGGRSPSGHRVNGMATPHTGCPPGNRSEGERNEMTTVSTSDSKGSIAAFALGRLARPPPDWNLPGPTATLLNGKGAVTWKPSGAGKRRMKWKGRRHVNVASNMTKAKWRGSNETATGVVPPSLHCRRSRACCAADSRTMSCAVSSAVRSFY